jgi:hypothetical protein
MTATAAGTIRSRNAHRRARQGQGDPVRDRREHLIGKRPLGLGPPGITPLPRRPSVRRPPLPGCIYCRLQPILACSGPYAGRTNSQSRKGSLR